jgi:hypothetical protein
MRVPNVRVVLAGLAAVAVVVGGSIATRDGPLGSRGASPPDDAAASATTSDGAPAPTTSLPALGTLSDRLARLPEVGPGELEGLLDFGGSGCEQVTLDLGTLDVTGTQRDVCAVAGAKFGVRLRDVRRNPDELGVVDLEGRPAETVPVPAGWDWWGVARDGVVFCKGSDGAGRLRRFGGGSTPLPSCPLTQARDGLVFLGRDRRSIVDQAGRRLAAQRDRISRFASVRPFGDGLLAIDTDLYGPDGRRLASFDAPDGSVVGASRDGRVVLVAEAAGTRLIVYRDGTPHDIDQALATRGGLVSPDGRHVLVQRDARLLVELDAVTLRPLGRLLLDRRGELLDWRSKPGA